MLPGIDALAAIDHEPGHDPAAFNEEFTVPAAESGSAFVPFIGPVCSNYGKPVQLSHGTNV